MSDFETRSQSNVEQVGFVANEIIVKVKPGVQAAALQSLQSSLHASVVETSNLTGLQLWKIEGDVEQMIASFGNHPAIEYIQPNYIVHIADATPAAVPNDPNFDELWGLDNTGQTGGTPDADIDAPEAWDVSTGEGVVVGVIDTGVDYTHPELADQMWTNDGETPDDGIDNDGNGFVDDYYGYDFVNNDGDPFDDEGHGTHVAGTIAAEGNNNIGVAGVAPDAKIMALKFLDAGGFGSTFDAVRAVEYAILMGADLTNNSWGGGGFSQALYDAIEAAGAAGQLFIAAAGNESSNSDVFPSYPAGYDLDNIISVAATDHNDELAWFSNYGETTVDLSAPGESIYSTVPGGGYATYNGTSMASPHVAGVAALILSQFPDLSPEEVKELILAGVDPVSGLDGITVTGGRLNAYNSLIAGDSGSISGTKWNDLDADGVQDAGESGLEGWTIYLDDNDNGTLDTGERSTLTDENGDYSFSLVEAGTYTVAEVSQDGWEQTFPEGDGTHTVDVEEDEAVTDVDFGNFLAEPAEIQGNKWNDQDADGVWDASESALEGWTIYLDENSNGTLDTGELSTITDANGAYSFSNLAPGTYVVAEVQQPGWEQTYPTIGLIEELFSADFSDANGDPSLDGFTIDNTGGVVDGLWHLSTGRGNQLGHSADDSMYFGQGEGENGGGNYNVPHTAGRITSDEIDLTGVSSAELSFSYFLETEVFPTSYDQAKVLISENGGAFEEVSSNAAGLTDPTTDWTAVSIDISEYAGSTIQIQFDFDTIDSVANAYEGWYVDDVVVSNIGNGTHIVDLDPNEVASDINFGNVQLEPGSISGSKWNDQDGDGVWDGNEAGLEGWTIYLDDNKNGQLDDGELSTVTDANGDYEFTDLAAGTYVVGEVSQPGWEQTYPGSSYLESDMEESNDVIPEAIETGIAPSQPGTFIGTGTIGDNPDVDLYSDVDFVKVELVAGDRITVDIDAETTGSTLDSVLRIFNSDGNELVLSDDQAAPGEPGSLDSYIDFTATADDTYYVGVSGYSNFWYDPFVEGSSSGGSTGNYSLTIIQEGIPGTHTVQLDPGESKTDIDFGNQQIAPPPPDPKTPIFGTPGNDELNIFVGSAIVFAGNGNDIVDSSQSPGGNRLYGGNGDDTMFAAFADRLFAGNGDDVLFAGNGKALMAGGAGSDQFWIAMANLPSNANVVADFTQGEDVIGIGGLGMQFDDLSLIQVAKGTVVRAFGSNLALLKDIDADTLNSSDFVFAEGGAGITKTDAVTGSHPVGVIATTSSASGVILKSDTGRTFSGDETDNIFNGTNKNDLFFGRRGINKMSGKGGEDVFVLNRRGVAVVKDFENDSDSLGIRENLSIGDLDFVQRGDNTVLLLDDRRIARLNNISTSDINEADFVAI